MINQINSPAHYTNDCIMDLMTHGNYDAYDGPRYHQALRYYKGNSTTAQSSYRSCLKAAIEAYYGLKNDPTGGAVFQNGYALYGPKYILAIDKNQYGWQHYFYKLAPGYILCSCH